MDTPSRADARRDWPTVAAAAAWSACNALQLVFTLAWTAGMICAAMLVYLLTGDRQLPLRMASRCWAPGLLWGAGVRFEVEGLDRVDWLRNHVFVANHASVIDICALFRALPVPLHFLLKQEMTRVPFVGWYAKAMGMVFIDRSNRRAATAFLKQSAELVRGGANLCIFPEGTRSRDGAMAPFKCGAFQTAIDGGADVVPVALQGSAAVLPCDGVFRVRPGVIRVRFGTALPMIDADGPVDRQILAAQAQRAVLELLARDGRRSH
ncbi:MAG: lysophospholipid acyltransferase family protein [Luteimonas sp.]